MKFCPAKNDIQLQQVQPNGIKNKLLLLIPAYTHNKQGLLIPISVYTKTDYRLEINSEGHIARSLERIFKRNIEILSTLKPAYTILKHFQFNLISSENRFRVKDVRSASLAICITLLNLLRIISGKCPNQSIIGTGLLRMDGSFMASSFEAIKEQAALKNNYHFEFTNANDCKHIFELEALLNQDLQKKPKKRRT